MRFYNSIGPNHRVVTMFMAEKGIELPEVMIDLRGGENRRAPYNIEVNPAGQTPALELDDGSVLTERMAEVGAETLLDGPEPLAARMRAEVPLWKAIVEAAGIPRE